MIFQMTTGRQIKLRKQQYLHKFELPDRNKNCSKNDVLQA